MTNLLFVYGSLMPALTTPFGMDQRARLRDESTNLGQATLAATLYDLGDYPGLVVSNANTNEARAVHGTLLRLKDPDATFAWLDPFEDIVPDRDTTAAEYQRIIQTVECSGTAASASVEKAWVYELRRVPPGAPVIASGMWHAPSP